MSVTGRSGTSLRRRAPTRATAEADGDAELPKFMRTTRAASARQLLQVSQASKRSPEKFSVVRTLTKPVPPPKDVPADLKHVVWFEGAPGPGAYTPEVTYSPFKPKHEKSTWGKSKRFTDDKMKLALPGPGKYDPPTPPSPGASKMSSRGFGTTARFAVLSLGPEDEFSRLGIVPNSPRRPQTAPNSSH
eukprot:TRINITY_DN15919_c0_g1_i1.p1 TRINITY_DN15919_c0_g1~~TRINITY_DN15919_c0_g1_i1.p1  ORF type:complete len:189 (-),score=3.05 TRINITY_DN15919_c0_g1_i1:70-636(-)